MDPVSDLKKRLLFKYKGHTRTYKQDGKNELKFVRTKKKENTEILNDKKRFIKELNMVNNFLGKLIQEKKAIMSIQVFLMVRMLLLFMLKAFKVLLSIYLLIIKK